MSSNFAHIVAEIGAWRDLIVEVMHDARKGQNMVLLDSIVVMTTALKLFAKWKFSSYCAAFAHLFFSSFTLLESSVEFGVSGCICSCKTETFTKCDLENS